MIGRLAALALAWWCGYVYGVHVGQRAGDSKGGDPYFYGARWAPPYPPAPSVPKEESA